MGEVDYSALYGLQDRVLDAVLKSELSFYVTGGTCLNRFYREERYSEDLDLFTNDHELFREDVREVRDVLRGNALSHVTNVDTRDFVRIIVEDALQVDLVNDRVPHYGEIRVTSAGQRIDNVPNITANKITAILGRDEPKDVFDLYLGARVASFSWDDVVGAARAKALFDIEALQYRLESFPPALLDGLAVRDEGFLQELKRDYTTLCGEIVELAPNSLAT
jgi:predicted nucleotidyltransferase component of viral defense system